MSLRNTHALSRRFVFTLRLALVLAGAFTLSPWSVGQTVIFSDDLSTGVGWRYSHFGGTEKPGASDISEADFGFNYASLGIPEAPHSDLGDLGTSGLRLAVNLPGQWAGDQVAAVYEDAAFFGQHTVQVDVWMNWASPSGVGSTEYTGVLAGFRVADAQGTFAPGQNGAGVLFDGDGDASCAASRCDYMLVKDGARLNLRSEQYGESAFGRSDQAGYDATNSIGNLDLQALFPSFDIGTATGGLNGSGTQPAGALGFQWVTVTLAVDPTAMGNGAGSVAGTVQVTLESHQSGNSFVLGTIDNSVINDPNDGINTEERPVNLEGGIGLMLTDLFSGAPSNPNLAFGLFDNVRVFDGLLSPSLQASSSVPEPSTFVSIGLAMCLAMLCSRQFMMRRRTR